MSWSRLQTGWDVLERGPVSRIVMAACPASYGGTCWRRWPGQSPEQVGGRAMTGRRRGRYVSTCLRFALATKRSLLIPSAGCRICNPLPGVAGRSSGPAELSMSVRPRSAVCLCVPVLLLSLSGCGPGRNEFAPPCPSARLVPELADLTRYASNGRTHDLTDMIV